jgi:hypothetical protein
MFKIICTIPSAHGMRKQRRVNGTSVNSSLELASRDDHVPEPS